MSIADNLLEIRRTLPDSITLVAVSKFHHPVSLMEAYEAGQRVFGESRAQELREKYDLLPKDIEWHFIGTLQTNKVKYYAPFVSLIHSVDSEKALTVIEKEAVKNHRRIDVLLEVHIAEESSKQGWNIPELTEFLAAGKHHSLTSVRIRGLMGMATFTDDKEQVSREFGALKETFDRCRIFFTDKEDHFDILSMGMSNDYGLAIEKGSTMVRIGSSIFGDRY